MEIIIVGNVNPVLSLGALIVPVIISAQHVLWFYKISVIIRTNFVRNVMILVWNVSDPIKMNAIIVRIDFLYVIKISFEFFK